MGAIVRVFDTRAAVAEQVPPPAHHYTCVASSTNALMLSLTSDAGYGRHVCECVLHASEADLTVLVLSRPRLRAWALSS